MVAIFANNATGKLGGDITTSSTTLILQTGNGALFPAPTGGNYFPITVVKSNGTLEIMKCTARTSDTLTVTRSQEGTTAKAFSIGDRVSLRMTAGSLTDFVSDKQPLDATLTALAGVTVAADKIMYATAADAFATTTLTAFIRTILDDATASDALTTLGMSAFIKTLIDDLDAATARATLGAQATDATLTALSGLAVAADKMIYATAADAFATATLTAFARTLLDDASASAALTTLGVSTFIQTLLGDADAATARATIGALSTTGTAAAATKLATARTINGVSFDGTAAITAEPYVEIDATAATQYLTFVDSITAGFKRLNMDSELAYNPSTNLLSANASSAVKLATERTLALSGGASGSASFDGTGNATIPVTLSGAGVLASCATGAAGGVGTYVLAIIYASTIIVLGGTAAGSLLRPTSNTGSTWAFQSTGLSGTWRFMSGNAGTSAQWIGLWLRIS